MIDCRPASRAGGRDPSNPGLQAGRWLRFGRCAGTAATDARIAPRSARVKPAIGTPEEQAPVPPTRLACSDLGGVVP
jgi:hypothetical protein